jgi:hypothetical protein
MPPSGSVCVGLCVVSSMVSSPVKLLDFAAADNLTTALLPLCPRKYSGIKLISSGMSESKGPVSHHKQSNAHHRRFAPLRCGVRKLRFCIGERGASARFHQTGMGSLRLGDGNGVRSAALDQATNRLPHGGDSNPKAGGKTEQATEMGPSTPRPEDGERGLRGSHSHCKVALGWAVGGYAPEPVEKLLDTATPPQSALTLRGSERPGPADRAHLSDRGPDPRDGSGPRPRCLPCPFLRRRRARRYRVCALWTGGPAWLLRLSGRRSS